jgi:hypothetical protein
LLLWRCVSPTKIDRQRRRDFIAGNVLRRFAEPTIKQLANRAEADSLIAGATTTVDAGHINELIDACRPVRAGSVADFGDNFGPTGRIAALTLLP